MVQARKNQAALSATTAKLGNASAIAKNSLMRLFGVQEDGSVRAGSALAWLNDKAEGLLAKFQEWSQDGTMDALAQKLDQGLARGAELASQGFQWLREHGDTLLAVLKPLAGAIVGLKLMKLTTDTVKTVREFGLFAQTVGLVTNRVLTKRNRLDPQHRGYGAEQGGAAGPHRGHEGRGGGGPLCWLERRNC